MKKAFIALFMIGMAIPTYAKLKEKHVVGTWSYEVEVDQQVLSGKFVFELTDGKLSGEVLAHDGYTYELTKVEIRDNNVLYFELVPDYDVFEITVTVAKKAFEGTVITSDMEVPIKGEKLE